ncbi:4Fe-4S ferredoxin iron-sulfur binding domain-containing protein [Desulfurobacterium thermolithotrophum DSM 11699]|uniref:4Fe-4S ferredoxin iron-sulfur binding domain-containing protein n=1 Tax=Desulfurobacterium thermolithotrophum (strain DSM 11699 / BSA) TaxID=868864 RepID=F0S1H0_DESTD|nr:4Fe-4S dicluster domain-containing protein [Desulfurobacterium thermolithotrophum]ADY73973.1 4Fe-4S ferredoxin iron-sulfur binding domain-containing protein [Desulfurobacterium thermolithotrophum DSM 11699]
MAFTVSEGMNSFVMCNPEKCIGCYTCMAACYQSAKERGKVEKPRLILVHTYDGSMPNQCRQCDDAPCANVCPVGALRFGKNYIEVYEEKCIDCKMCVMVCPFGAIRPEEKLMSSDNDSYKSGIFSFFESLVSKRSVAIKCDLCEENPACVKVCPTKALMFVTPSVMEEELIFPRAKKSVSVLVKTEEKQQQERGIKEKKEEKESFLGILRRFYRF